MKMKETTELITGIFGVVGQGFESFADGVQGRDAADFIDEAITIPATFNGLKKNFKPEAIAADIEDVDILFHDEREKLIRRGVDPFLADAMICQVKGIYGIIVHVMKKNNQGDQISKAPSK